MRLEALNSQHDFRLRWLVWLRNALVLRIESSFTRQTVRKLSLAAMAGALRSRVSPTGIWIAGLLLTFICFLIANYISFDRHRINAQKEGSHYSNRLRSEVHFIRDTLARFAAHLSLADDRNCESRAYALDAIADHPALQALSHNVIVLQQDRDKFESDQRARTPGFRITERQRDGGIIPARARDRHMVVTCIEPIERNVSALGFDLMSEPSRAQTIARALKSGQVETTPRINLVQDSKQTGGVLLMKSIRSRTGESNVGTASGVLSFKVFFDLKTLPLPKDWTAVLYQSENDAESPLYVIAEGAERVSGLRMTESLLTFSDREWFVKMEFPLSLLLARALAEPWSWIWLLVGLLGTLSSARLFSQTRRLEEANRDIAAARDVAENSLRELNATQASLMQSHKIAALGQLSAGIAHELKNPLNFVNNFAQLSSELLEELKEAAGPALSTLEGQARADLASTLELLSGNLRKIAEHGKRANDVITGMLSQSRGDSEELVHSDMNALLDYAQSLAFHSARAHDKEFNVNIERDFSGDIQPIAVSPQALTRVFLNLLSNALYAVNKRRLMSKEPGFKPTVRIVTRDLGDSVEVRVRDNGNGVLPEDKEKLFNPFFTTKPPGEGTGLGLSISYDIIAKQHGGAIQVESEPGVFTEFTVRIPRVRQSKEGRSQS